MKTFLLSFIIFCNIYIIPVKLHAQDRVVVWSVNPNFEDFITTNKFYRLSNIINNSYLDYYTRSRGINLAFNHALAVPNIKFSKPGNPNEPIKYGDRVAIHVERGGYLYYSRRTWGINLRYSSSPVYEWEIRDNSYLTNPSNPNHANIPGRSLFSLINRCNNGYLIYGSRTWGPNLTWATTVPPATPPAQANLFLRFGPFPFSSTSGKCTGRIVWTFTPIQLTGTTGRSTEFVIDKFYEAFETNVGPREWWCFYQDIAPGLKAGKWKIKAQTPLWGTECQVVLSAGNNRINFTQNKVGCSPGLQYP
ncbi:MAG: hypothetical protein ABIN97_19365 [Ginsengibacter sp.]